MAYVSTETTRRVRGELKQRFPNLKFSVSKKDGTLRVRIMAGDLDFRDIWEDIPDNKQYWKRYGNPKPHFDGYVSINTYHPDDYNPKYTDLFKQIISIMKGTEWFDNSDPQIDYFSTAYYLKLSVGKWNKPYQYTGTPRMDDIFRRFRGEEFEAPKPTIDSSQLARIVKSQYDGVEVRNIDYVRELSDGDLEVELVLTNGRHQIIIIESDMIERYIPIVGNYGAEGEEFEAPKPQLTKNQMELLNHIKVSAFHGGGRDAYVKTDRKGWDGFKPQLVQKLLDKGIITIPKHYGRIESLKAYTVMLNPIAWEYPFKYSWDKSLKQKGNKIVRNKRIHREETARKLEEQRRRDNMTFDEVYAELFGAEGEEFEAQLSEYLYKCDACGHITDVRFSDVYSDKYCREACARGRPEKCRGSCGKNGWDVDFTGVYHAGLSQRPSIDTIYGVNIICKDCGIGFYGDARWELYDELPDKSQAEEYEAEGEGEDRLDWVRFNNYFEEEVYRLSPDIYAEVWDRIDYNHKQLKEAYTNPSYYFSMKGSQDRMKQFQNRVRRMDENIYQRAMEKAQMMVAKEEEDFDAEGEVECNDCGKSFDLSETKTWIDEERYCADCLGFQRKQALKDDEALQREEENERIVRAIRRDRGDEYYAEGEDEYGRSETIKLRYELVDAIKSMPKEDAWDLIMELDGEYGTGLTDEEEKEWNDAVDNQDLDKATHLVVVYRNYISGREAEELIETIKNRKNAEGEDITLKDSAKLGFGLGAGLLGFRVALLGASVLVGGLLLNRKE